MKKANSEDGWWRFLNLCLSVQSPDQLNDLFNIFLTFEERHVLANRYLIVKDLLAGKKTQREIAEELQVSTAQITRGSNQLKQIDDSIRELLEKKMR